MFFVVKNVLIMQFFIVKTKKNCYTESMLVVDYNEFLSWPEKYLLKALVEGVLITRNGYLYVKLSKPCENDQEFKDFFKKYKGIMKIEDLDPNDPYYKKYLGL